MQQPSVGRIVHYVSHGTPPRVDGTQAFASECRAAIITAVRDHDPVPEHGMPYVDLCVLNPTGLLFNESVGHHEGDADHVDATAGRPTYRGGTWHWPERV